MSVGARIKQLRKTEMLIQQDFAERLGVKGPYISELEKGKKTPSEQLILGICREFGVRLEWLKTGQGEMYESRPATGKGKALIEEIYNRINSPLRPLPLSVLAKILGLDPENIPRDFKLRKDFPDALWLLLEIFEEGDSKKIEAIMAQLKVLRPEEKADNKAQKRGA